MRQSPDVRTRLDQWKNQLIDTTKKNRLLFFTPLKTASIQLRDPGPENLFGRLVREEKPLTFARRQPSEPAEVLPDLEITGKVEDALTDDIPVRDLAPGEVLTDRGDQDLNAVLYRLRLRGRTAVAEQGINILFVAFGVLHWQEPNKPEQRISPLILVPVELRRQSALDPYRLFPTGEEVLLNPTLTFLLQRDCHLILPSLPDDLDSVGFDDYCRQVESLIHKKDGWSVRREAHFGTFSFQKLMIYSDLEVNAARLCAHPLVQALAGDTSELSQPAGVPSIGELDDALAPERTFQVLDADSSQQVAIEAAKRGASFVLQGPPGTGKSQTIANIIAEMLAAGKRVLFVAEKMAALQVVYSRLKARKLDDFCLEVHSAKASKQETLAELGRALPLRPETAPPEFRTALSQLASLRRDLNGTVQALHTKRGAMGWTPFEVHGRLARLQHLPDLGFDDRDPTGLDPEVLAERNTVLMRMEGVRTVINGCETHPWRGCLIPEFTFQVQSEIEGRFLTLRDQLRALQEATGALASACHLPAPASLKDAGWLIQVAERASASPRPPAHWWADTDLERLTREIEADERRFREYLQRRSALLSRYRQSLLALDLEDLRERLARLNEESLQAFGHSGAAARPVLWENACTLKPVLDDAVQVLAQARSVLESLSETCGVAVQPTVRGMHRLLALTKLAADDTRPTQEWFTAARLRAITDRAHAAASVYPRLQEVRERLLTDYTPGILKMDVDAMISRFRVSYAGPMRFLMLGYWRDMRSLRGQRRATGKLTVEAALADLEKAREVQSDEGWVRDNQEPLDAGAGRLVQRS